MTEDELELESIQGIGPTTKQKLVEAGIKSVLDLAIKGPTEVAEAANVELSRAIDMCNKARTRLVELGKLEGEFVTASQLYKKRLGIDRITTGSRNLDDLFGGGLESHAVTEFYGEFGSGKTQICHTSCVTVQLPRSEGGLAAGAVYVDTENTFRPERIFLIAKGRGLDPDSVLEKITVAKAYNSIHQEFIVGEVAGLVQKNNIKLLVVDSAVAHYRAEFLGRATLAERQQRLNRFMHLLTRIAETLGIVVAVTNQVQSAPDVFFGDPSRPTGGHVVAHTSTYRVYLRKAGKNRIARMVDSPYHPEREVVFVLNEKGIDDPPEETSSRKR